MFSDKTFSQLPYSTTPALWHELPWYGCTQSRQAAMVMMCDGETAQNRSVQTTEHY